jgi:hypothetical protein
MYRMPPVAAMPATGGIVWTTMVHNGRTDDLAMVVWHTDTFDPRRDPPYLESLYLQLERRLAVKIGEPVSEDPEELLAALNREAKQYQVPTKRWTTPETIDREFGYHPATDKTGPVHERVRELLRRTAHELNDLLPECPRKTEALGNLRSAMWAANSAVAAYGSDSPTWVPKPRDAEPADHLVGWALAIISNVDQGNWPTTGGGQTTDWIIAARRFLDAVGAMAPANWREQLIPLDYGIPAQELAARAYAAYGDVTEWKNYRHEPMPRFVDLPEKIQKAWVAAATRAFSVGVSVAFPGANRLSDKEAAEAVFQAMGAVSAAWEHIDRAGVFQDDRAADVCRRLLERLGYGIPEGYRERETPTPSPEPSLDPVHPSSMTTYVDETEAPAGPEAGERESSEPE